MADIQLLTGAGKIKDQFGRINTSLTNLNDDKMEKIANSDLNMNNKSILNAGNMSLQAPSTLTIDNGAITASQIYHLVDTEGSAASDELVTINNGVTLSLLLIRPVASGRRIVIKNGVGNIFTRGGADIILGNSAASCLLIKFGANSWMAMTGDGFNVLNSPASLVASGNQQFGSGFQIKWGFVSGVAHGTTITFPVAFPTGCFAVVAVVNAAGPIACGASGLTAAGFNIAFGDSSSGRAVYYIAIGY